MVALRMAVAGFLPELLRMTDCARAGAHMSATSSVILSRADSEGAPTCLRRGSFASLRMTSLLIARLRLLLLFLFRFFVGFFLQSIGFLLRQLFAQLQIALAIEVDLPFDERGVDARVRRKGMAGPDREIGVLADIDRTDALVEAQLHRGIERAEL